MTGKPSSDRLVQVSGTKRTDGRGQRRTNNKGALLFSSSGWLGSPVAARKGKRISPRKGKRINPTLPTPPSPYPTLWCHVTTGWGLESAGQDYHPPTPPQHTQTVT
eukprot:superscaffoldBa00002270_g13731